MRVVLSNYDSRGGIEPFVALALTLRERGADVVMCVPPDCADRLAEVDLPLVPVGGSVHALVHGPVPPSPADVPKRAAELMAALFEKLLPVAEESDVLVTSGVMSVVAAARSVAEKAGIRSVLVGWCPIFLPSPHQRPHPMPGRPLPPGVTDSQALQDYDRESYDLLFGETLNANRAAVGLPPVAHVRDHVYDGETWIAADPVLAPFPDPYVEVVRMGPWITPDDRPLPADVVAFLDAGTPPVYVGLGSVRAPDGFARAAVEAVRAQGLRVLLARGWAGLEAVDDGADCLVVGEVNQQALFPRLAAVVHHGGAGTTTTATRAGVPQVVVPQIGDQPYWAGRVADLGIGVAHDGPTPTTESLAVALETALETSARARTVAGTIRTDGAAEAARLLLEPASSS